MEMILFELYVEIFFFFGMKTQGECADLEHTGCQDRKGIDSMGECTSELMGAHVAGRNVNPGGGQHTERRNPDTGPMEKEGGCG